MTASVTAEFTVTSGTAEATTSTTEHVSFVKQWTLNAATTTDTIDSIDLDLAGRVYVSYVSGLPSGVLGYVNVSGDSQAVVDAVAASNHDAIGTNDNYYANHNDRDLYVRIGNSTSTALSGYLLTEIFLASSGVVTDVTSQRSAQVVVEDGVLVSSSTTAELQVEASGSSAVYVSAASTAVSVRQLQLDAEGSASLQFSVKSVAVTDEAQLDAQGSATISLLGSSLEAAQLQLDAQNTATICISAQQVTATNYDGEDSTSRISMPNAASKYDSTGSFACDETSAPAREPSCVSTACAASSSSGNTVGVASSGTQTTTTVTSAPATANDDDTSDDTNASSTPRLAALAVGMVPTAIAMLL
ncbi:uncharacterized protein KRP23_15092 [Phytophthora ramorum]|uniref:uncharacterized protein n=1 Tax=Phytophthora ramorum TaxID=164328 RepID=UPI00309FABB9|nr:hypothetical protein KRP23_15092 [Phytophthora ramorum]